MHQLHEILELYRAGEYRRALQLIEENERRGLITPEVLIWKSVCIQLESESSSYELEDAAMALKQAVEMSAERCIEALVELAYFYLNVQDEASLAMPLFQKAFELSRSQLTEIVIGTASCLEEIDSPSAAAIYLDVIKGDLLDWAKIEPIQKDLEQ